MKLLRIGLACVIAVFCAVAVHAATISVCASGCTNTNSQLQTALNNANPGDTILLQSNFTYQGTFYLPDRKTCAAQDATCYITIKTGVNSTGGTISSSSFPAANKRIGPSYSSVLAKFQPTSNNAPGLRTIEPGHVVSGACGGSNCRADWWKIQLVEFIAQGSTSGSYNGFFLLIIGSNEDSSITGGATQSTKALVPNHFIIDQVYVHGDQYRGQRGGIYINADNTTLQNSYVSEIKATGQDTQAVALPGNQVGPVTIINNYLQGSTETVISGGDTVRIKATNRTILASPAPTTTSATLSSAITDMLVGDAVTFRVGGADANPLQPTQLQSAIIQSISGAAITWSPALTAPPDVPGNFYWNIVPKNLTFQKNYVTKDPTWRNPIVSTPLNVALTSSTTGGTFGAGTYTYVVVGNRSIALGNNARSTPTAESSIAITSGTTNSITITWTKDAHSDHYYVYGRSAGGENFRMYLLATSCGATTCSVTDTNAATSGTCATSTSTNCTATAPTTTGTVWLVKNVFELKSWDTALIEGNVFEYSWVQGQSGYAVLFTPVNQNGDTHSNIVANITFRKNWIRHANALHDITARSVSGTYYSQVMHDMVFSGNLAEDMSSTWGGGSVADFLFTGASRAGGPHNVTIDHNTVIRPTGGNSTITLDTTTSAGMQNFVVTNNQFKRYTYGVLFGTASSEGNTTWNNWVKLSSVWNKNVMAGATCSLYPNPSTNYCPTVTNWQAEFTDYANGNYALKSTSTYHNQALDGTDIGADIPAIKAFTDIAISGDNSGAAPPPQPSITTSTLPSGTAGIAYSTTFVGSGGTPAYSWALASGTLPVGLTLSSGGVLSGTTTDVGSFTFTVQLTDAASQIVSKSFSLTIVAPPPPPTVVGETRPLKIDWAEGVLFRRDTAPDVTTDQVRVGDLWFDTATGLMKVATDTSPPSVDWRGVQYVDPTVITCDVDHAGAMRYVVGATNVADTFQVCAKNSSNVYAWRTVTLP